MTGLTAFRRVTDPGWTRRLAMIAVLVVAAVAQAQAVQVSTFNSIDVPVNIPEVPNPVGSAGGRTESNINVSGIRTPITKVVVSMYITHEVPGDLVIYLIPPAGGNGVRLVRFDEINSTQVPGSVGTASVLNLAAAATTGVGISNQPAGRVGFDDASTAVIDPANPAVVNNGFNAVHLMPGTYRPNIALGNQLLATFAGMTPAQTNGVWKLRIDDEYEENYTGRLVGWSLTVTEPGPHTWTGEGTDDLWSNPDNWEGGNIPTITEPASLLIFPAGAVGPTINDVGDVRVGEMDITGAYTLSSAVAQQITLTANAIVNADADTDITINLPIEMVGAATFTVSGEGGLILNGNLLNDTPGGVGAPTFAGTGPKTVAGAGNNYTGLTTLSAGTLDVSTSAGLGTGAAGTVIANGATLRLAAGVTVPDTVTVQGSGENQQGALVFAGNGSVAGMTLVANQPAQVSVLGGGAATVNAVTAAATAAPYTLTVTNTGTFTLNGSLPTTTTLNLNGGDTVFAVANQPNLVALNLSGGADLDVGPATTISGPITVASSTDASEITGTSLSLGGNNRSINVAGGSAGAGFETSTNCDLLISADIANGSISKRGSGVLRMTGNNAGVGVAVNSGVLAASGDLGSISVRDGVLAVLNTLDVGGAVALSPGVGLVLHEDAAPPRINAQSMSLNGAVLQPYSGDGTTIIVTAPGNVSGTFEGKANGAGITYNTQSVVLAGAPGGAVMTFSPATPLSVDEKAGTVTVRVVSSGASAAPFLRTFGGTLIEGRDVSLVGLASGAPTWTFDVPIVDNFIDTGTVSGTLAIVPQDGSLVGNSLSLTIRDNDGDDTRTCGFGTGLTVFLLLGFALAFRARLRRP